MIDLLKDARPDERFELSEMPVVKHHFDIGLIRRTSWTLGINTFVSWWFLNHLQWYRGSAKCDGTRTRMAWAGQLGDKLDTRLVVVTTTPSEMSAFRIKANGPSAPTWDDMGGS